MGAGVDCKHDQGTIGLEVNGLDLYLHVNRLKGETLENASRIKW